MNVCRKQIFTTESEVTKANVIDVLRTALSYHEVNANRLKFLFDYESGDQPILRIKTYRPEINVENHDNIAHEVTKFHVGYEWNPITLVQRGDNNEIENKKSQGIAILNEQYELENLKTKSQRLGKDVTIGNLGYSHIDVNSDYEEGDSYFKYNILNPLTTFVVRSSYYLDRRVVLGVTYRVDAEGEAYYTCYTKDSRYDIKNDEIILEEMNPLGRVPIVEWIGNYDGMGIWEHEISEMDNLNLMISDFSNTVEQNMQAVWHTNDIDFPTEIIIDENGEEHEVTRKPKNGDWLQSYTSQDGKTPLVEALSIDYDYGNMLANIMARRSIILEKCYMPNRTDGTNSTGVAQDVASGFSTLDIVAEGIQACQESAKMDEIKLVLAAIKLSPYVPIDSPLLSLKASDIVPNVKRERLSEMSTKANTFATYVSHGINGLHALQLVNAFSDTAKVWEDSKTTIEKYQSSIFDKQDAKKEGRTMQDLSDQVNQSPILQS